MDSLYLALKPSRCSAAHTVAALLTRSSAAAPEPLCHDPRVCVRESVVCVVLFYGLICFPWRMIAFQCPAAFCLVSVNRPQAVCVPPS